MSIQENFSTHGSIACRLNDSGIARSLIFLTEPDVGSVTEKGLRFHRCMRGDGVSGLPDELFVCVVHSGLKENIS